MTGHASPTAATAAAMLLVLATAAGGALGACNASGTTATVASQAEADALAAGCASGVFPGKLVVDVVGNTPLVLAGVRAVRDLQVNVLAGAKTSVSLPALTAITDGDLTVSAKVSSGRLTLFEAPLLARVAGSIDLEATQGRVDDLRLATDPAVVPLVVDKDIRLNTASSGGGLLSAVTVGSLASVDNIEVDGHAGDIGAVSLNTGANATAALQVANELYIGTQSSSKGQVGSVTVGRCSSINQLTLNGRASNIGGIKINTQGAVVPLAIGSLFVTTKSSTAGGIGLVELSHLAAVGTVTIEARASDLRGLVLNGTSTGRFAILNHLYIGTSSSTAGQTGLIHFHGLTLIGKDATINTAAGDLLGVFLNPTEACPRLEIGGTLSMATAGSTAGVISAVELRGLTRIGKDFSVAISKGDIRSVRVSGAPCTTGERGYAIGGDLTVTTAGSSAGVLSALQMQDVRRVDGSITVAVRKGDIRAVAITPPNNQTLRVGKHLSLTTAQSTAGSLTDVVMGPFGDVLGNLLISVSLGDIRHVQLLGGGGQVGDVTLEIGSSTAGSLTDVEILGFAAAGDISLSTKAGDMLRVALGGTATRPLVATGISVLGHRSTAASIQDIDFAHVQDAGVVVIGSDAGAVVRRVTLGTPATPMTATSILFTCSAHKSCQVSDVTVEGLRRVKGRFAAVLADKRFGTVDRVVVNRGTAAAFATSYQDVTLDSVKDTFEVHGVGEILGNLAVVTENYDPGSLTFLLEGAASGFAVSGDVHVEAANQPRGRSIVLTRLRRVGGRFSAFVDDLGTPADTVRIGAQTVEKGLTSAFNPATGLDDPSCINACGGRGLIPDAQRASDGSCAGTCQCFFGYEGAACDTLACSVVPSCDCHCGQWAAWAAAAPLSRLSTARTRARNCSSTTGATTTAATAGASPPALACDAVELDGAVTCLAGTEFEAVAPTATSHRVCRNVTACAPDQFETSPPAPAADRACSATMACTAAQYEVRAATATSDRACVALTACAAGQFESVAPTATGDRRCTACTVCSLASSPCQATSDAVCAGCSVCGPSEVQVRPCDEANRVDTVCEACAACQPGTEFQAAPCTASSQAQCDPVAGPCHAPSEYEVAAPTPTSNRQCLPVSECTDVQFETAAPTPTSDRGCSSLQACAGTEFEAQPATPTSDRSCQAVRECLAAELETQAPTAASNRACAPTTPCAPFEFVSDPSDGFQDNNCSALTVCQTVGLVEFELVPKTLSSDRVCRPVMSCVAGRQYEVLPPTPVRNRVCRNTTACTESQFQVLAATSTTDRTCAPVAQCSGVFVEDAAPTPTSDRTCRNAACDGVACQNGGTCVFLPSDNSALCACVTGFSGPRCQTGPTACVAGLPCLNGGQCRVSSGRGGTTQACVCPGSFIGANCETLPSAADSGDGGGGAVLYAGVGIAVGFGLALLVAVLVWHSRRSRRREREVAALAAKGTASYGYENPGFGGKPGSSPEYLEPSSHKGDEHAYEDLPEGSNYAELYDNQQQPGEPSYEEFSGFEGPGYDVAGTGGAGGSAGDPAYDLAAGAARGARGSSGSLYDGVHFQHEPSKRQEGSSNTYELASGNSAAASNYDNLPGQPAPEPAYDVAGGAAEPAYALATAGGGESVVDSRLYDLAAGAEGGDGYLHIGGTES